MKFNIPTIVLLLLVTVTHTEARQVPVAKAVQNAVDERVPEVIDVSNYMSYAADTNSHLQMAENGRFQHSPYVAVQISAPNLVTPGASIKVDVQLANYEPESRMVKATLPLTPELELANEDNGSWVYNASSHSLYWVGVLDGANLEYRVAVFEDSLPYIDLAQFGVPNLCQGEAEDEVTRDCDNETKEFNLGINNDYTLSLYGEELGTIAVNSNGLLLGGSYAAQEPLSNGATWLPSQQATGHILAPLWRDNDFTLNGRWHAAILTGYIPDGDVFYAQWHNAPHKEDINSTARYAAALVLNGPRTGDIFYIYDNVSNVEQVIESGYVIGLEDQMGERGFTYAYSGDLADAVGRPPEGITLSFTPALMNEAAAYSVELPIDLLAVAYSGELVPITASVETDSPNEDLRRVWATHYFNIQHLQYLPMVRYEP